MPLSNNEANAIIIVWILMIAVGVAACGWKGGIVAAATFIVGALAVDSCNHNKETGE